MQVAPCVHLYAVKPHICYLLHYTMLLDCLRCPYYRIACGIGIIEARLRAVPLLTFCVKSQLSQFICHA